MNNLIIFNKDFKIVGLINSAIGDELKDNKYNSKYSYINNQDDLFYKIEELQKDYVLSFKHNPITYADIKITIDDLILTKKKIEPKKLTENSLIADALLQNEINNLNLNKKIKSLAALSFNSVLENAELKKQIKTLSSAVFDLIIKK